MNMIARRIVAVLCAVVASLALTGAALAADPAKKPDGFRGVAWGAEVSTLGDMVPVETEGDFADYDRKGDKKELGGMPVEMVTYGFYKGRFYHAAIAYAGVTGFEAIQEQLVVKYGNPDIMTERTDEAGRRYALAAWNWPGYAYIGHRRYLDGGAGRVFYFYSPLVEASKAAAASSVATAAMSPEAAGAGAGPPARPAAPEPAAPGAGAAHVVAKGDMISSLAKRYGVSSAAILAANPGVTPTNLKPGQTLRIPAPGPDRAREAKAEAVPAAKPEPQSEPRAEPAAAQPSDPKAESRPEPGAGSKAQAASAPGTAPKAAAGAPRQHVVEFEDTLSALAKRYGVTTAAIVSANPGLDPRKLRPGKKIVIP